LEHKPSVETWKALAEVVLVSTVVFNRRREGEVWRMLLDDYENHNRYSLANKDVGASLSDTEKCE